MTQRLTWMLALPGIRPDSVIVRCSGKRHKVRLAPGKFWRRARCGACGAAVDRSRIRRVVRWIAHLAQPASAAAPERVAWVGTAGYLLFAVVSAGCLWWLSDRWWLATTLLFGPRWVLLLPLAALVPASLRWDRALLVPLALAAIIVLDSVMGLRTGWRSWLAAPDPTRDVTVMTLNAKGGSSLSVALTDLLFGSRLDVLAIQECGTELLQRVEALQDWHTDIRDGLCLVSRYPITTVSAMEREAFRVAGGAALVVTYRLEADPIPLHVTNLHLETPRAGLERIRAGELEEGISKLEQKSSLREIELRRAARWAGEFPRPQIVLGDFNTPPESPIYRDAWSDWTNAFSVAGRGFGFTRMNGWIRARIDHILVDGSLDVIRAWVGPDVGSDHRPALATIRLKRRGT
ncbi:MAG: endonuclease/exonuclease/phosphatase family protein [Gemmatimonadota bacterium]|nr:endonuclease/exonuclease/phosphatase family protein [Gemmatimonadota bacterium]MDH3367611.1 endonuclease/exonuclease/phosphatase family protein [Gemmatimonadota bacterium]MDH3478660.1 endonuclease/exonuclease/phosphatase family protein [Gemmatimonadota bacterium]MDH3571003.1 endonuclease/exonuclease/phosphatase family protein [Gemmatimonadota bacterium]MDH5550505.1 endonuclease/exonuclease/phosphatase family protein [Gemmatimonadota bacterium]